MRQLSSIVLLAVTSGVSAAEYRAPTSAIDSGGDFRLSLGETLPGVHVHDRTLGTPRRGEDGKANNAILTFHGTTGSGANSLRPEFAGELIGKNQRLDAGRNYLNLPADIGPGARASPAPAFAPASAGTVTEAGSRPFAGW
jgi:homoserine O-acetyltransferase